MHTWLNVFAAIFTAAMMFSAAAAASDLEIRRISAERKLLARAFLANVVVVPILAAALLRAFHRNGDFATGAVLAAICPGAPFGTYLAGRSRGDVALAVIMTCGMTVIALITAPLTSWLIFGPGRMVALPKGLGLLVTGLLIVLPVLLGKAVRRRSAVAADCLGRAAGWVSLFALVATNVAAAGLRSRGVRGLGWQHSALILSLVAASMGVGALSGRSPGTRATLATSTGLRNAGLAFLFAEYKFHRTQTVLGVAADSRAEARSQLRLRRSDAAAPSKSGRGFAAVVGFARLEITTRLAAV
jgi:BASS family bile acid:Na+ symporter